MKTHLNLYSYDLFSILSYTSPSLDGELNIFFSFFVLSDTGVKKPSNPHMLSGPATFK